MKWIYKSAEKEYTEITLLFKGRSPTNFPVICQEKQLTSEQKYAMIRTRRRTCVRNGGRYDKRR